MTTLPHLRPSVTWRGDDLQIIDQRHLPARLQTLHLTTVAAVCEAIATLAVRGAPAIGACGAYGLAVALDSSRPSSRDAAEECLRAAARTIIATRPTAVNLAWAVERTLAAALEGTTPAEMRSRALACADRIVAEDEAACSAIGAAGADVLAERHRILTHCNTGRLAVAGIGTALGVIYTKAERGHPVQVLASETRPLLQGARLTAWELADAGIDVRIIPDSASAAAIAAGMVDAVIVGADRIAANGDTANKIGTLAHALHAAHYGVPFYVAAPLSTFDPRTPSGAQITIELRSDDELRHWGGEPTAPPTAKTWNPAFDVTPAALITAFFTEAGTIAPPYTEGIAAALERAAHAGERP